jgi:hypothetical protein
MVVAEKEKEAGEGTVKVEVVIAAGVAAAAVACLDLPQQLALLCSDGPRLVLDTLV